MNTSFLMPLRLCLDLEVRDKTKIFDTIKLYELTNLFVAAAAAAAAVAVYKHTLPTVQHQEVHCPWMINGRDCPECYQ
jgi:hypothetical protein